MRSWVLAFLPKLLAHYMKRIGYSTESPTLYTTTQKQNPSPIFILPTLRSIKLNTVYFPCTKAVIGLCCYCFYLWYRIHTAFKANLYWGLELIPGNTFSCVKSLILSQNIMIWFDTKMMIVYQLKMTVTHKICFFPVSMSWGCPLNWWLYMPH
jgi:hypothetical protein